MHLLNIEGKTSREPGHRQTSVRVVRHLGPRAAVDVETVGHVLEDVLRHRAPRPLDEHPDAHQDAVEKVLLHLDNKYLERFLQKQPHLWKSPGPTNESYQASLDVVVDNGGGGPVLQQEHQVAVVEVVPLVRYLSVLLICLYKKNINFNRKKVMHLDDYTASLSYKNSTVLQLKGSVVTSLLLTRDICW